MGCCKHCASYRYEAADASFFCRNEKATYLFDETLRRGKMPNGYVWGSTFENDCAAFTRGKP